MPDIKFKVFVKVEGSDLEAIEEATIKFMEEHKLTPFIATQSNIGFTDPLNTCFICEWEAEENYNYKIVKEWKNKNET